MLSLTKSSLFVNNLFPYSFRHFILEKLRLHNFFFFFLSRYKYPKTYRIFILAPLCYIFNAQSAMYFTYHRKQLFDFFVLNQKATHKFRS